MSTFVGFSCLRSSPSLTGVVRLRTHQITGASRSSRTTLDWVTGSARCFSPWPTSRNHDANQPQLSPGHTMNPQWRLPPSHVNHQRRTLFGRKSQPVLTDYLHLPADYKDEDGLPFRKGEDLDLPETSRIFQRMASMTPERANKLLKILHGRRVAGTLDDPSLRINTKLYSQREIDRALKYLRSEVPVNEILNAGLRAEDELRELEADLSAKESDNEETSAAESEEEATAEKEGDKASRSVYGESILDKIREANIARAEAQEKAEAEQRKKEDEAAAQNWGGLASYDPALHRGLHPRQLEHYEAATSDLDAPPAIPRWRILLPTTAFVAALLASLYLLVTTIAPPRPAGSSSSSSSSSAALETNLTVGAIVLLNVGMFIAWKRVRLWKYLNRHFILDFVAPRPHQILTAMATHQDPRHLLKTMLALFVGGSLLIPEIGPVPFVATYIASGVCGFLATMYTHVARGMMVYMFGASSAGFGVICAYFWLYRFDGFKVLGLPPDPLQGLQGLGVIGLLISFFALVPMVRKQGGNVDWMSHLAGMLTGIGCAALMEGRWKAQKSRSVKQPDDRTTKMTTEGLLNG